MRQSATTNRLARLFTDIIDQAPLNDGEKIRLRHFAVFVFLGTATMLVYSVYNLAVGDLLLASLIFLTGTSLTFGWLLMCHLPLGQWVYRTNGVLYGGLLLYMLVAGGDDGSKSLWLFSFPLITLFLMGRSEGLCWSAGLFVLALALLLLPLPDLRPYPYGYEFLSRFGTVYCILTAVAYWFEYFREHYRQGMSAEAERLRAVVDTLPDAVSLKDEDGRHLLCNRAFLDKIGLPATEVVGKQDGEIQPRHTLAAQSAIPSADGLSSRWEETLSFAGGSEAVYDTISLALRDEGGQGENLLTVSRDITAIRRTETALERNQERLREILTHSGDILYRHNLHDGSYDYISDAFCRSLGYTREETDQLAFAGATDLIHPDYRQVHRQLIERVLRGNGAEEPAVEYPMRTKAGTYLWFSDRMTLARDLNGEPEYIIGCNREITAQKQAEEAAGDAHRQMLTILDSIDAHVYVVDMTTHRILYMNRKMRQDFGEHEGEICWAVFRGSLSPCAHCTIPRLIAERNAVDAVEWEGYNPLTGRWYLNYDRLIRWIDQRPVKLQVAFDITRVKSLETDRTAQGDTLHQARKMEALGRMAGAIAHHINNQLMVVIGSLEMVADENDIGAFSRRQVDNALAAASKSAAIGGLLLQYLGLDRGSLASFDLGEACRRSLPRLAALLPATATLDTELEATGLTVQADAQLLDQILTNLVTNAAEAIGLRPGRVGLTLRRIEAAAIAPASIEPTDWQPTAPAYGCLEVSDTGDGIAPDHLGKIFDPFFSTKFTGRGLGLAVVLGLVKAWQGAVQVASGRNGTTFRLYLPLAEDKNDQTAPSPAADAMPERSAPSATVLVIDDDPMVRDIASLMVGNLGYEVLTAASGEEAVSLFGDLRQTISLVFLDQIMPGMDGWQTLAALRAIEPTLPVVMVSGIDQNQQKNVLQSEQPQALLSKPYTLAALRQVIGQTLSQE